MNFNNRYYKKALNLYNNGLLEKALIYCEKANEKVKNKNYLAMNLKGIIYYIKGNIPNAENAWKVSLLYYKNNNVAKKYLIDLEIDKNKMQYYNEALKNINKLNINSAIDELELCSKSDFNAINVNNGLAFCYIKKGEFEKALKSSTKVLSLDSKNIIAKGYIKEIKSMCLNKSKINIKTFILSIFILLSIALGIYSVNNIIVNKKFVNKNKAEKKVEYIKKHVDIDKKSSFNYSSFKSYIDKKDFDKVDYVIDNTNKNKLSIDNKLLFQKGIELLENDGVSFYYNEGKKYIAKNEFKEAIKSLDKASKYSNANYLKPYIIYSLAIAEEKNNNIKNAVKYYEEYLKNYSGGEYEAEILYNLAIIFKDIDKDKSKKYCESIKYKYSDSIYYNDIVKSILN